MRLATLLFIVVAAAPALAQVEPDTTAPWRYYPLGLGDVWHYHVEIVLGLTYGEAREVVGDTVIDGRAYRIVSVRRTSAPGPSPPPLMETRYVRFDSVAGAAVRNGGSYVDGGGCRLDSAFPADPSEPLPVACPGSVGDGSVSGGYETTVTIGTGTYTATVKAFGYFTFGWQHASYAAGIGLLNGGGCEGDCYEETLHYARVGGVTYGTPLVAAEPAAPATALALTARPNPATGPLTLHLALPEAGPLAVEAFDALGRRVHHAEHAFAAGTHALALDAAAWAPGLYVVRVTAGGATASARLVRR